MPKYNYTALDIRNKKVIAVADAKDEADLRRLMRDKNLVLVKFSSIEDKYRSYRLKSNETAEFSRQMASMLGSGITVVRAMEIMKERDIKAKIKPVYERLYKDVQQGYTLSEAMRLHDKSFPELLINMYASGEASGQLENVAAKMAVHYEKEHRLNSKVMSAMTYPILLLVVTVVVVLIIFIFILPVFFEMFEGMELPVITKAIIALSQFLTTQWYMVIIGALILAALIRYLLSVKKIKLKLDQLKLKLPVIGKLLKIIYTARFARTLSSLYSSGISMINALEITGTIINNKYIESQFSEMIKDVRNGAILSECVGTIVGFDKKLSASIMIGEESGRLDTMLESTADSFDYEAEMATGRLVQLVEPIMIVFMAVIIGSVMLSVVMPLISSYQNFENLS